MESESMLTPRDKSPLPEKFSLEEDQTHNAASSRTVSPTHYQQAVPAPNLQAATSTVYLKITPRLYLVLFVLVYDNLR